VGDEHHGEAELLTEHADQPDEAVGAVGIEAGGRLVEQQQFRLQRQGARQGHALDHAAGKLGRHQLAVARQ
jgi:hypothetical protein